MCCAGRIGLQHEWPTTARSYASPTPADSAPCRPAAHSQRRKLLHKAAKGKDSAKAALKAGLPTMAQQPPTLLGCVSEAFGDALDSYLESNPDRLLAGKDKGKDKGRGRGEGGLAGMCLERYCCCVLVPWRDGMLCQPGAEGGRMCAACKMAAPSHSTAALTAMHLLPGLYIQCSGAS